ncbi:serine hydrolase [Pseudoalteromonas luteoviolacea]|uniref:serine hydrolase n=1 Tax=Pseudoalteromonas luteoviolacea TaxID=43657 RepID=UPI001B37AC67|nr:serine hydrolase [Pseudoalteromonas luteoviolacea]
MKHTLWHKALLVSSVLLMSSSTMALTDTQLEEVEKSVNQAMKSFSIPGLAVGIVNDGKVVMAKGFGIKSYGKSSLVDEHTLFGIASNSKAFTAAALAMLVEQGKLNWDDPVVKHIPEFELYSKALTEQMTIRDLLSHRSGLGLGAGDLMIWPDTDKSIEDILKALKHLKPVSQFRNEYNYNNLMFVVAGEVVGRVSGMRWQQFIEQNIFSVVGMKGSYGAFSRIPHDNSNFATGTIKYQGQLEEFIGDYLEDFRGAGSIASNVTDMTKWMQTQMNAGTAPSGEVLFSAHSQSMMWHPHIMRIPKEQALQNFRQHFKGYGLGWSLESYFGYKKVGHMGGILGMGSQVAMIPEKGLGVVLLSNQQAYPALNAIANEVFEQALGLEPQDWVADSAKAYHESRREKYSKLGPVKPKRKKKGLPHDHYTGTLRSPWYGDVIVEKVAGELRIDFTHTGLLKGSLHHHDGNTFVVKWDEKLLEADAYIHFKLNGKGHIETAEMEWVNPEITDFSFDFHDLNLEAFPKPKG